MAGAAALYLSVKGKTSANMLRNKFMNYAVPMRFMI